MPKTDGLRDTHSAEADGDRPLLLVPSEAGTLAVSSALVKQKGTRQSPARNCPRCPRGAHRSVPPRSADGAPLLSAHPVYQRHRDRMWVPHAPRATRRMPLAGATRPRGCATQIPLLLSERRDWRATPTWWSTRTLGRAEQPDGYCCTTERALAGPVPVTVLFY